MEINDADLERRVLAYIGREGYQPVKPRVIAKKMNLDAEGTIALRRLLKRLVREGKLAYGAKHLVRKAEAVKPVDQRVTGKVKRTSRGHGFVRPDASSLRLGVSSDIYIPRSQMKDAADGDRVAVKLLSGREPGRTEPLGQIMQILERRTAQFVGSYFTIEGEGFVRIDGNQFPDPIHVGDPGAKSVKIGDKIVVEMLRFPSARAEGAAVVTEVLGRPDAVGVDTRMIVAEFELPTDFTEEVLDDSRERAKEFQESIEAPRVDLTGETIITIDPVTARDFDDAISLTRIEKGHWRLGVHIADVAHFVRPNTPLDNEAYRRGNSVYLPDLVIPMLPELISNGLASLQPEQVRYTLTAFIEFDPSGVPIATELCESAIKSCRRFTYEEVDEYLADREAWKSKLTEDVHRLLGDMHELAMMLRRRRMEAGSIDLTVPEVEIDLNPDGQVIGAHRAVNTESHQIIEEFMLAANVAVAERLRDEGYNLVRRIHEAPAPLKLKDLTEFVRALGIQCNPLQDRFEIKRVIAAADSMPEREAIHFAVLRAMQKARYGPDDLGHYALAFDAYCHFTSPIRRYPDLVIHRMVKAIAHGKRPADEFGYLATLGDHCSETEVRAERAERELKKLKLLNFYKDKLGTELFVRVTGVERFGLFAQGEQIPVDGFIGLGAMPPDLYDHDAVARSLVGRRTGTSYRLGDPLLVRVLRVDFDRREIDFEVIRHRGLQKGGHAITHRFVADSRRSGAGDGRPSRGSTRTGSRSAGSGSGRSGSGRSGSGDTRRGAGKPKRKRR